MSDRKQPNGKTENSDIHFYRNFRYRRNSAEQPNYRFLNLPLILPAIPPAIQKQDFNLLVSLSYRDSCLLATLASAFRISDPRPPRTLGSSYRNGPILSR